MSDELANRLKKLGAGAQVERAVFDVTIDGRTELVSLALRDGQVECIGPSGATSGPYVDAILELLSGEGSSPAPGAKEDRVSIPPTGLATRSSVPPPPPPAPVADVADRSATEFEGVVDAIVRAGMDEAATSPSVEEAVRRLLAAVGDPLPLRLVRFVGRLRTALEFNDATVVARVLRGALDAADSLKRGGSPLVRADKDRVQDAVLAEIGREWLRGTERAQIERRYLMDLGDGSIYAEERTRSSVTSLGPSPRKLGVGFAEVAQDVPPVIRIHQYVVTPFLEPVEWERLTASADDDWDRVARQYRVHQERDAWCEPVALLRPARFDVVDGAMLDDSGRSISLALEHDRGASGALLRLAEDADIQWVSGRLVDKGGSLGLVPLGAAVRSSNATEFHRLR